MIYKTVNPPLGILWALTVIAVMIPQVEPPPPLNAQYRSELLTLLAVRILALAVTISTSRMLSTPRPYAGAMGPCPPPIDQPMMPTVEAQPDEITLFCLAAELWASLNTIPGPSLTFPSAWPNFFLSYKSQVVFFIKEVLIKIPFSQLWRLMKSCPVPATIMQILWSLANITADWTCYAFNGKTTKAGFHELYGKFLLEAKQNSVTKLS